MKKRQQRLDDILAEMKRKDTVPLIVAELPQLIALAKERQGYVPERVAVLEHLLQERGVIPQPPERASARAMRLSAERAGKRLGADTPPGSLNRKIGLDSSD